MADGALTNTLIASTPLAFKSSCANTLPSSPIWIPSPGRGPPQRMSPKWSPMPNDARSVPNGEDELPRTYATYEWVDLGSASSGQKTSPSGNPTVPTASSGGILVPQYSCVAVES